MTRRAFRPYCGEAVGEIGASRSHSHAQRREHENEPMPQETEQNQSRLVVFADFGASPGGRAHP